MFAEFCLLSWIPDNVLQEQETKMSSSLTNVLQYLVWFQAESKSWGLAEKDMGEKSLCIGINCLPTSQGVSSTVEALRSGASCAENK